MTELRLPKLPDRTAVKITFTASAELNHDLQEYAAAYKLLYGISESLSDLIPYMLKAFIEGDAGFRKAKRSQA